MNAIALTAAFLLSLSAAPPSAQNAEPAEPKSAETCPCPCHENASQETERALQALERELERERERVKQLESALGRLLIEDL